MVEAEFKNKRVSMPYMALGHKILTKYADGKYVINNAP